MASARAARAAVLVAIPVGFSGLLWLHPMLDDYAGVLDVYTRFQLVHVAMVLAVVVLAAGVYLLLDGMRGRAASVARVALVPFVAFYVPYVAFEGVGVGVLGQELNGLAAAQRDAITAGLVEDFARNPILGEPGVFWALGTIAWVTVIVAAVVAFRRAGAPLALQVLIGLAALIGTHAPPLAPIGWLCFAGAGLLVLRARRTPAAAPAPPAVAAAA
jgi:hypothetical protein